MDTPNDSRTVELNEIHRAYLEQMAQKHQLPDLGKALRCVINYAMVETDQEKEIFTSIRCTHC